MIDVSKKWSDYTFDECPHCNHHTGQFAPTYAFNTILQICSNCKKASISDAKTNEQGKMEFKWFKLEDYKDMSCAFPIILAEKDIFDKNPSDTIAEK